MADHTDQKLTHRRTELGSIDADFLYGVSGASSFPACIAEQSRRRELHPSTSGGTSWVTSPERCAQS